MHRRTITAFMEELVGLDQLEVLALQGIPMNEKEICSRLRMLISNNKSLQELRLADTQLDDSTSYVNLIADVMMQNDTLNKLKTIKWREN